MVVDLARDPARPATGVIAAGSYNAFRADEAAARVMLPLFRNAHTGMRLSSEITALNPGAAAITVRLRLFGPTGSEAPMCTACEVVLPAASAHTWLAEDTGFTATQYGSARVEGDGPVVAIAADVSRAGTFDTSLYRGHGAPATGAGAGAWTAPLPNLRRGGDSPAATATPSSGDTVTVFAIGFVDAFGGSDPACPGCDGVFGPEDMTLASQSPLPRLTYALLDDAGQEVARTTSEPLADLQRALLNVPRLAQGQSYTLVLLEPPASAYAPCANETTQRVLRPDDFVLGSVRRDFHFTTRSCTPPSREPRPAVPTAGPPPAAAPKGAASSGVIVANLGDGPATLTLDLYPQAGGPAVSAAGTHVPPLGSHNFYVPGITDVAQGAHAGIATGDAAIGTLALTLWPSSLAHVIHDDVAPATDIVVPWVVKGVGGQNTIVAVQNYDAAANAEIHITLTAEDGTEVVSVDRTVGPGTSILLDVGRDPAFAAAPIGFMGTLRARAATRIAATALVDFEHSPLGVAGFNGEPAVSASSTLLVPLARHHAPVDPARPAAGWNQTRIAIANPGTTSVDVTARFTGVDGTCAGDVVETAEPATVPPDGVGLFDLAGAGLPEGCAAAVRFEATGGVLGVAIDTVEAAAGSIVRTAAAYNLFRASDAARTMPLPIVRRVHTTNYLSTDIAVLNPGTTPAAVEVEIFDARLNTVIACGAPCAATIAPGESHLFVTDGFTAWPLNRYGSATVRADRPVLVTAAEVSRSLTSDASMYRAFGTGATAGLAGRARPLPLLLNQSMARLPGGPLVAHQAASAPPDPSPWRWCRWQGSISRGCRASARRAEARQGCAGAGACGAGPSGRPGAGGDSRGSPSPPSPFQPPQCRNLVTASDRRATRGGSVPLGHPQPARPDRILGHHRTVDHRRRPRPTGAGRRPRGIRAALRPTHRPGLSLCTLSRARARAGRRPDARRVRERHQGAPDARRSGPVRGLADADRAPSRRQPLGRREPSRAARAARRWRRSPGPRR